MNKIIKEDIERICLDPLEWEKLNNKKILITGASGFLAFYMTAVLLEINNRYGLNMSIYALCRSKEKAYKKFADYLNDSSLRFIFQDVMDDIPDEYCSEIIIHAASPANYFAISKDPYSVIEANVIAYDKLMKKAQKWNTEQILLFSSSAVYGSSSPRNGADESSRYAVDFTNTKNVYCMSKQMCEMMSVCFQKMTNIKIKSVRPFVVYGPGDSLDSKKAVIDFLNNCISSENIILKSERDVIRSYIYISDAIRGIFYVLFAENSGAYNISDMNSVCSVKDVALAFSNTSGTQIEYKLDDSEYLKNHTSVMIGNNEKLRSLGWQPEYEIEKGIQRMVSWGKSIKL